MESKKEITEETVKENRKCNNSAFHFHIYVHYHLPQNKKEIKLWGGGEKGKQLFKTGIFGHSFFKIRLFLSTI